MKDKNQYVVPGMEVSGAVSRQYVCASIKPSISPAPGVDQLKDMNTDSDAFGSANIEF